MIFTAQLFEQCGEVGNYRVPATNMKRNAGDGIRVNPEIDRVIFSVDRQAVGCIRLRCRKYRQDCTDDLLASAEWSRHEVIRDLGHASGGDRQILYEEVPTHRDSLPDCTEAVGASVEQAGITRCPADKTRIGRW